MATRLDMMANVALIGLCLVAGTVTIMRYVDDREPVRRVATATYAIGDTVSGVSALDFAKTSNTIVLFLRSSCHFCTESMPFYRRLNEAARTVDGRVRIAVVSFDSVAITQTYLREHGLPIDEIYNVAPSATLLNSTPTLLVVDNRGRVKVSLVGKLSETRETELLSVVAGL